MKVYRDIVDANGKVTATQEIFDIMEWTYSGTDMGERSITTTVKYATPIDFQAGDYVEFNIADLIRQTNVEGGSFYERFYLYTMPTIKKTASPFSAGDAFEHTITFYPRQYELGCTQMRDLVQDDGSGILYTGWDEFSFYGGAKMLMDRIIAVLHERYGTKGVEGVDYWGYKIADSINEERNTALEKFQFDFSGNNVMDAILKLNESEGINTKFFINSRMIYVGYKRPYIVGVDDANILKTVPFDFQYGKTSHLPRNINYGNLFTITKSIGNSSPITRLYAYGADRNLHRFYCSDRIKSGRYVNRLMLPSFANDGKTDYIESAEGVAKFGIREGGKTFDNIYPSLRYFTYGDLREIKYVIKLMGCGLESDENGVYTSEDLKIYTRPLARVQCYKVVEGSNGANSLQESYPPVNLAIFLHATGKVVKCTLYTSAAAQKQHDSIIPTRADGETIAGACFAVHDAGYDCSHDHTTTRDDWFSNPDTIEDEAKKNEIEIHQINYTDTHWITDIFEFESYTQTTFLRHGYSAYCYPRINKNYPNSKADSIDVNSIIDVGKVLIEDTDLNVSEKKNQATFEIYLRDIGFQINEQTWFGDKVFVFDTPKVNFLDGNLGGYSFEIPNESEQKEFAEVIVPAILPNGTRNAAFFDNAQDPLQAEQAYQNGAYWRILLKRCDTEINNYWLPNTMLNASAGDRIVLLDIFMPDVYIRVAENRLLREAQKYLDANDDGDIQYTFDIDKVRLLQIPAFGLQMREGAIMRIVDNDLGIKTTNSIRFIRNNSTPVVSTKSLLVSEITGVEEIPDDVEYYIEHRDFDYLVEKGMYGEDGETYPNVRFNTLRGWTATFDMQIVADDVDGVIQFKDNKISITNVKHIWDATAKKWVWEKGLSYDAPVIKIQDSSTNNRIKKVTFDIGGNVFNLHASETVDSHGNKIYPCSFYYEYDVLMQRTIPGYNKYQFGLFPMPSGTNVFCEAIDLIDFQANKYYEVTIDVEKNGLADVDRNGKRTLFALVNGLGDGQQYFTPEYTVTKVDETQDFFVGMQKYDRYIFKFTLGEDFNDSTPYYPAIRYISDGNTEKVSVRLVSIVEKDSDSMSDLNYVDLGIDTISIRCNENTRVSPATTQMREITATVKEETRASAWVQVMQRIESSEILGEQTIRTQETVANMARRHYRELLALKNSIFDPDGTCDQTFLQVMMMQVGADSMNYQLDRTRTGLNSQGAEVRFNCAINGNTFTIDQDDTLRHYVYTEGSQGGTWRIKGNKIFALDGQNTYFVALKCEIDGNNGEWICSTEQHKVNEDEGYWYFNWAILNLVSGGYVLTETRGNAYMYGDNLVCGKISTLAGNSYFDLTKGNFVLSNGEKPALSYINGVLTISGVATDKDAEDILAKLGIVEDVANNASSTAQTALDAANNISVGGRNYIKNSATTSITAIGETYTKQERLYFYLTIDDWNNLRGKYVSISCDVDIQNAVAGTGHNYHRALFHLAFRHTDGSITYPSSANLQIKFGTSDNPVTVKGRYDNVIKVPDKEIKEVIQDYLYVQGLGSGSVSMSHPKLEIGNKATDWTPAPEDTIAQIAENKAYTDGLVSALGDTLQKQIDGVVNSYFREGKPTLTNYPANEWITDALKQQHEGDTYTDITKYVDDATTPTAGHSWRWCRGIEDTPTTSWHWHEIADSDAVRALQAASKAQDTADGKRRTFVTQPTTPYDVGDLWAQGGGSGQDILYCKTARATGAFQQSDWAAASSALEAAATAKQAADNAQADATSSLSALNDMSSDSKITPQEKVAIRTEWASIQQEYAKNTAKATEVGVAYTTYATAYNALNTYLINVVKLSDGSTISVTKSEFNAKFSTYYAENVNVLNAIAKALADKAVENVQIGGRNILRGSQNMSFGSGTWESGTWRKSGTGTVSDVDISDAPVAGVVKGIMLSNGDSGQVGIAQDYYGNKFKVGDVLTQSMWVKASKAGVNVTLQAVFNSTNSVVPGGSKRIDLSDTEWHRISYTTTPLSHATEHVKGDNIGYTYINTANASIVVCAMKLEFGNKATDWTPAPEDIQADLDAVNADIEQTRKDLTSTNKNVSAITDDNIISGGTEKSELKREWQIIAGENMLGTADGSYYKAKTQASTYNVAFTNMTAAFDKLRYAMASILANPNANTTISSGIPIDSTGTTKVSTKDTFNALWKNYYDEELVVLNDVSNKIKTVADAAKAAADDAKWAPMWQNNVFLSIPSGAKVGMRLSSPNVNMYTRLCRLSAGTYKSSRGIENIPTLLDVAQQLTYFGNSVLLVGASTIVNWGDEFTVNVDTDVYVVFGTLSFFAQFKNSGSLTTTTTTINRVWSINDVIIYRTVSEAVEATQKAVSALDYLKAALTDGSTEIAGGLTMTHVLMLKSLLSNGESVVTAGMSGLTTHPNYPNVNENVLMWGGGTYEDAYYASNDDNYEKEDGTPITTLLKKDGTGKIGVFKIGESSVVVDNGDSKTIITTDTIQGFCDENNIGYTIFKQTYTSSTNEPQARILMERTFDGTKTGTVSIQDLFVSVSVYGNSQLRGATAKLKISVVSGAANTTTIIKQEEIFVSAFNSSSKDYILMESYTRTFANLKSFKIELEEESSTYSGSIDVRFSCYVGVAGNSRTCVLARDGIILSSGTGDRFFIRPTDNSMAIVADIPIISSPDDVKSLEIGQLFTDSTGIVRRYSRDDAQNASYYERKLVKVSGGNEKLDLSDYRTTEVSALSAKNISGELIYNDIKDYDEASIGALYKYGGTSTYDNIRRKIK